MIPLCDITKGALPSIQKGCFAFLETSSGHGGILEIRDIEKSNNINNYYHYKKWLSTQLNVHSPNG